MDPATVKSIANQKVFVPLSAVLDVQSNFERLRNDFPNGSQSTTTHSYLRGIAYVIKQLGLPINIPSEFNR